MIMTNVSDWLWEFCIVTDSDIMSRMSRVGQRPVLELLTSNSVEISEYMDFKLYDLIWYWYNP